MATTKVYPPVKHVLDKFRHKLPKEELKRLGKDVAKKLVASDYKNNRVNDPAAPLTEKQERNIKKYVKDFLDRAVAKYEAHHKRKASEVAKKGADREQAANGKPTLDADKAGESPIDSSQEPEAAADDIVLSDVEDESPDGPDRKRKRDVEAMEASVGSPLDGPDVKRLKEDGADGATPPPPPPPPPENPGAARTEEAQALLEQEEALMRENEEAQRLDDEEQARKKEATSRSNLDGPAGQQTSMDEHGNALQQELLGH